MHPGDGKPKDLGPAFEGVFSIPVCYDPTGNAFDTDSPNYPCQCGENGSETGAFQVSSLFLSSSNYQFLNLLSALLQIWPSSGMDWLIQTGGDWIRSEHRCV